MLSTLQHLDARPHPVVGTSGEHRSGGASLSVGGARMATKGRSPEAIKERRAFFTQWATAGNRIDEDGLLQCAKAMKRAGLYSLTTYDKDIRTTIRKWVQHKPRPYVPDTRTIIRHHALAIADAIADAIGASQ